MQLEKASSDLERVVVGVVGKVHDEKIIRTIVDVSVGPSAGSCSGEQAAKSALHPRNRAARRPLGLNQLLCRFFPVIICSDPRELSRKYRA